MSQNSQPLKPGEKILFTVAGAFVVFAVIAFIIMQFMIAKSDKPLFETRTHADLTAEGQKGSELFRVKGCTTCHRALRNGTNMGQTADLDGIGSRRTAEWMYAFLTEPEKNYGSETMDHRAGQRSAAYVALMPKEELHAIAVFLSELKSDQGSASAPVPPKGDSPFIDSMVKTWAPQSWKEKYPDVRDAGNKPQGEGDKAQ
ncbi:cytochrome c [Mariprofundus erugo]|uniref:Cytochrome c n=1 Tax=Mariprofundus erugo TaxID=2528639 RepID=A0A5R9GJT6_9PROT|nr:c-type cytochrome [Mariprofundus erugo]TLS66470.1 cytochrome c [Mariprofundus erugo]TLS77884.1 cytochrome c [Mariprofundus erugo]